MVSVPREKRPSESHLIPSTVGGLSREHMNQGWTTTDTEPLACFYCSQVIQFMLFWDSNVNEVPSSRLLTTNAAAYQALGGLTDNINQDCARKGKMQE